MKKNTIYKYGEKYRVVASMIDDTHTSIRLEYKGRKTIFGRFWRIDWDHVYVVRVEYNSIRIDRYDDRTELMYMVDNYEKSFSIKGFANKIVNERKRKDFVDQDLIKAITPQ